MSYCFGETKKTDRTKERRRSDVRCVCVRVCVRVGSLKRVDATTGSVESRAIMLLSFIHPYCTLIYRMDGRIDRYIDTLMDRDR